MAKRTPLRWYWTAVVVGWAMVVGALAASIWIERLFGSLFPVFLLVVAGVLVQGPLAGWLGRCLRCGSWMGRTYSGFPGYWPNDFCGRCGHSMRTTSSRRDPAA